MDSFSNFVLLEIAVESFKLFFGVGVPKNEKKAIEICLESSVQGDQLAQAFQHYYGWETQISVIEAKKNIKEIIKEKEKMISLYGKEYLSYAYNLKGILIKGIKIKKAIKCFEISMELSGNPDSMFRLAELHYFADLSEPEQDFKKAFEFYKKSANKNHLNALLCVAFFYKRGEEGYFEKCIKKSIFYFEKCAQLNCSTAYCQLSLYYKNGDENEELEKDIDKAAFFMLKSFLFQKNNENQKLSKELLEFISTNRIEWKPEYHIYWNASSSLNTFYDFKSDLDQQVFIVLCISKFRFSSNNFSVRSLLVKGISLLVIKFLCHFKHII